GWARALQNIAAAIKSVLQQAGVGEKDITSGVLGLAGVDFAEEETKVLEALRRELPGFTAPWRVVNDSAIALYSGADAGWGMVSVNGSGCNVLARDEKGRTKAWSGLGYEFGDCGGGIAIIRQSLHAAFRSMQQRGRPTALARGVLHALRQPTWEDLRRAMHFQEITEEKFLQLVPLVFALAAQGDAVATGILEKTGKKMGESVVGMAYQMQWMHRPFALVLSGSVWQAPYSPLTDCFMQEVSQKLPQAMVSMSRLQPVAGAVLWAAADAGRSSSEMVEKLLRFPQITLAPSKNSS
ncbi:MAG: hypothetical protein OWS74_09245, partial [Firmicutes bacterium]|nr:hypothetical protein [Bacillota bacterium]